MANYNKQFNFRNGVQVDDDNLVVTPTGLVGIGTTIPTEILDVDGNTVISGFATASQLRGQTLVVSGKAGRSRWLGRRPRTRAVVMNPVDHPMGGGEGKASGGHPRSKKGIPAKGYRTRNKKKFSNKFIIEKRK